MTITTAARQDAIKVHTLLQDKPWNMLLKRGELRSPVVQFDFDDIQEASDHFKPLVRDLAYDCGELAIVTYLQARAYNKPLVLLPFVVTGNFHHGSIHYNSEKGGALTPVDLAGRRVGVRTYSQTTGVWVRGVLRHEYGVDLDKVTWVTFDDAHLAEHRDPPNCQRAPAGKKLVDMLRDGEVDAAIPGNVPNDPRIKPLIPDADAAAAAWWKKYGVVPINHMFVVTRTLYQTRPDVVREIYRLLTANRAATASQPAPAGPNLTPNGIEANRKSLGFVIDYAFEQKIIPRRFTVDELFDDATDILRL
jgi:4,5-dihydroxyphthalate decarboxylase